MIATLGTMRLKNISKKSCLNHLLLMDKYGGSKENWKKLKNSCHKKEDKRFPNKKF